MVPRSPPTNHSPRNNSRFLVGASPIAEHQARIGAMHGDQAFGSRRKRLVAAGHGRIATRRPACALPTVPGRWAPKVRLRCRSKFRSCRALRRAAARLRLSNLRSVPAAVFRQPSIHDAAGPTIAVRAARISEFDDRRREPPQKASRPSAAMRPGQSSGRLSPVQTIAVAPFAHGSVSPTPSVNVQLNAPACSMRSSGPMPYQP